MSDNTSDLAQQVWEALQTGGAAEAETAEAER